MANFWHSSPGPWTIHFKGLSCQSPWCSGQGNFVIVSFIFIHYPISGPDNQEIFIGTIKIYLSQGTKNPLTGFSLARGFVCLVELGRNLVNAFFRRLL